MENISFLCETANKDLVPIDYPNTTLKEPIFSKENEILTDIFYNNISHELRTPLNVVMSSIQLFEMMGDDIFLSYNHNKFKSYNSLMKKNCFRLLRVINNLIDSSKFDSGNISLRIDNHNIVKTLNEIIENTKSYAKEKGLKITLKSKNKKIITAFDEDKLTRAILNIISNALKFTPRGGRISIDVKKKAEYIYIVIEDTGIGIPEDKIDSIFERFVQADSTTTRNHEGIGIGLSIANSIVNLHDGEISVKSELGKGSVFKIMLPVKTVEEDEDLATSGKAVVLSPCENAKIELSDI